MRADARPSPVLGAVAVVVLAATVLTGCGGDDPSAAGEVPAVTSAGAAPIALLTRKQARTALLTGQNLGGGFTVSEPDGDADVSLGCLDTLDDIEGDEAPVSAERTFDATNKVGLPSVLTGVWSYDDVAPASAPFPAALTALEGCTRVDATLTGGVRVRLRVSVDSQTTTPDADEQVNISATGSAVVGGAKVPFGLWATVVRVDNHVVTVSYGDIDAVAGHDAVDALTRAAVGRLVAVVAGEEPSQTLVGTGAQISA